VQNEIHDKVVEHVARFRFPFPGQTTWPSDYVTLTNAPRRQRAIRTADGEHFPDIVVIDGTGRTREIGEVEMSVEPAFLRHFRIASEAADNDTPTGVQHFFLYVPLGQEAAAQRLLEDNKISYSGVRGFTVQEDGQVRILPFVTRGDAYDHQ
jgi:hypothetical protein